MTIYYLMIEAIPCRNNPESKELGGAFVNCWVKASTQKDALKRVQEFIKNENWIFMKVEDIWEAQRQSYIDLPDSLECYDEACEIGLSAVFNTWPIDEDNNNKS